MNRKALAATMYEALKDSADKINDADSFYGKYALRKVAHVNANSPLETLTQVGKDLVLIALKVAS